MHHIWIIKMRILLDISSNVMYVPVLAHGCTYLCLRIYSFISIPTVCHLTNYTASPHIIVDVSVFPMYTEGYYERKCNTAEPVISYRWSSIKRYPIWLCVCALCISSWSQFESNLTIPIRHHSKHIDCNDLCSSCWDVGNEA